MTMNKVSLQIMADAIKSIDPDTVSDETRSALNLLGGMPHLDVSVKEAVDDKVHDIYISLAKWQEQCLRQADSVGMGAVFGPGQEETAASRWFTEQLNRVLKDIDNLPDDATKKTK